MTLKTPLKANEYWLDDAAGKTLAKFDGAPTDESAEQVAEIARRVNAHDALLQAGRNVIAALRAGMEIGMSGFHTQAFSSAADQTTAALKELRDAVAAAEAH